ncbi:MULTISPECIES: 1-deoxy-D-xylulose-5-phosphate reductoisomerase [unclassified Fusibacter]|uniref:1-deoxy-D-xylulose-5-phosphate reductoisomerase n=1 Tax=unclassified Fusibacter TaxID=2624464 RepID=UPI0010130BF3|nr:MULTISPECIES: 1-deoxy-D-xylulose-5-phosphate reductoisomerase [unclassified Fusibacter]MCK8058795.1 1-deoxy-D-xylulose-5-phosphate reductoisomerase [Fusibacter sp. A2]NPE21869.1 1-deoxy-D-xylulose-5-phosphate reductoisomerase [Fusibacter sp. A1]RXV61441.1 1-deoxy-D-xylulose-5-phosphate reductoisomerase [Fusibacter sp. A1]
MKLAILGSTGSIGTQALNIIENQNIKVSVLSCSRNVDLILEQYKKFKPEWIVIENSQSYEKVKLELSQEPVKILCSLEGLIEVAQVADYDVMLTSVVGAVGLRPTIEAVKRGKRIALANKETLVVFGEQIMRLAAETGSEIIPVDSEHSALFQALQGNSYSEIEKLILTASGGPFRGRSRDELLGVTKHEALRHPNWSMGAKITIDSSTLMNKGLEVIEARWLFGIRSEAIDVVVHPESIVHSLVQYVDGSVMAQMGLPDMMLPIHYALHYPNRIKTDLARLDLAEIGCLNFSKPDLKTFPCLQLAYDSLEEGGSSSCVLNAANEVLVEKFLKEEIGFYDIPRGIEMAMSKIDLVRNPDLETVLSIDNETRSFIRTLKF